jgi:hypothetical protein
MIVSARPGIVILLSIHNVLEQSNLYPQQFINRVPHTILVRITMDT